MNVSKIYSALGNNNSLLPLAIKDIANCAGVTASSYITGSNLEGKDRFIDEFGTELIWLFGIPVYKKILDFALFKPFNLDAKIDPRILKNDKILNQAIEFAPNEKIKNALEKVVKNQKLFKSLAIGKFATATTLTALTYFGLTKFRHKYTENQIKKEFYANQQKEQNQQKNLINFSSSFDNVHKNKKVSFTGGLQDFMFSPLKNMMILDGVITTERFTHARNKQDFIGYAIKEGGFWTFVYFAGERLQKHFEKSIEKLHDVSITLDNRVIENEELKKSFETKSILTDLKEFPFNKTDDIIYKFINENPQNLVVKVAKKSDIIKTIKNSNKIDTRAFVDIDEVKNTMNKLEKLYNQYQNSNKNATEFFDKVKYLKRTSILKNLKICTKFLGLILPATMLAFRLINKDNTEFQTKKEVEQKLQNK